MDPSDDVPQSTREHPQRSIPGELSWRAIAGELSQESNPARAIPREQSPESNPRVFLGEQSQESNPGRATLGRTIARE